LLVLGAGLTIKSSYRGQHTVAATFVRYAPDGPAILTLTNRGRSTLMCASRGAWMFSDVPPRRFETRIILLPRTNTQLLFMPHDAGSRIVSVQCFPAQPPSGLRRRIESLLTQAGINLANTGYVVSVYLPPR